MGEVLAAAGIRGLRRHGRQSRVNCEGWVDSRAIVRVCAGPLSMNSTRPTCGGDRNVGRVEFTDSTYGQASQGACLAGMGRSPVSWLLCPGGKGDGQSNVNGGRNLDLARFP